MSHHITNVIHILDILFPKIAWITRCIHENKVVQIGMSAITSGGTEYFHSVRTYTNIHFFDTPLNSDITTLINRMRHIKQANLIVRSKEGPLLMLNRLKIPMKKLNK